MNESPNSSCDSPKEPINFHNETALQLVECERSCNTLLINESEHLEQLEQDDDCEDHEETRPDNGENYVINAHSGQVSLQENAKKTVFRASPPKFGTESFSFSLSAIYDDSLTAPTLFEENNALQRSKLFDEAHTTVYEASSLTELFCSKFNLSDECSSSLHTLIKTLLPEKNNFPSGYAHVQGIKRQYQEKIRSFFKSTEESYRILTFRFQLRDVFLRNLNEIIQYSKHRTSNRYTDFTHSICPIVGISDNKPIVLNLVLFSDGVNIKKSTLKKELWPIWIQIADLQPRMSMARNNIVLAVLFVGGSYPDWEKIVPHIEAELSSGINVESQQTKCNKLLFKVRLMIADLGAKNRMLNMLKFNRFYGCHVCTVKERIPIIRMPSEVTYENPP